VFYKGRRFSLLAELLLVSPERLYSMESVTINIVKAQRAPSNISPTGAFRFFTRNASAKTPT
jgi:hypothetical protein